MLPYTLKKSWRARSLRLSLNRAGDVVASAPAYTPKFVIDKFVCEHEAWLKQKQTELKQKLSKTPPDQIVIFGKTYQLVFGYQPTLPSGFVLDGPRLLYNNSHYLLQPKTSATLTAAEKQKLQQFLRQTLQKYLLQRLPALHQKMQISKKIGRVSVKDQSSRWGSCSSQGNLNFNYHLVNYDPKIIDYVLIHELAHLVHLDHSSQFWALVAKYDGAYKAHRRALK